MFLKGLTPWVSPDKQARENFRIIFIEVDLMCYNYKNNARKRGGVK